ncbi:hypothetical protein ACSLBF_18640 (plasmid) [Pseudoalteromonas sp. T1lg65]|uniref:hypothetical protein n=1 Tax=Pseudoalteromonas sp. T1lg65 TaxID=2077101 RepID=UPI003F7A6860
MRNKLIIGCSLLFVAAFIIYLNTDIGVNSNNVAKSNLEASKPKGNGEGLKADKKDKKLILAKDLLPNSKKVDKNNNKIEKTDSVTFYDLENNQGLDENIAVTLMAKRNFPEMVNTLEKVEPVSFEKEAFFLSKMQNLIENKSLNLTFDTFNCSDSVCAASVIYENEEQADQFIQSFISETADRPVSIAVQPVLIDGYKELRFVFNHVSAKILVF